MKELRTAPESLFWYWINERHRIYLKRQAGEPKPWTQDAILQEFKFTNAFRQLDRGTVWLREHFLEPHADDDPCLLAFNICWYRMFNWWGTGELLGWQTDWDAPVVAYRLKESLHQGRQVFTGAHIVYSRPGFSKVDAIVNVCTDLWNLRHDIVVECQETKLLQAVFNLLTTVDSVGGFMAYEMVSDMRWTKLLSDATDKMTWANPGPGAKRGLRRLGMPHAPDKAAIESMQRLLNNSQFVGNIDGKPYSVEKHVPPLEMRDIEHSLCEFDKYCRVKFGEGYPRARFNG